MHASYVLTSDVAIIMARGCVLLRSGAVQNTLPFLSNNHCGSMHLQRTTPLPHIGQLSVLPNHPICSLSHFVTVIGTNSTALNNFFTSVRTHDHPSCRCSIKTLPRWWRRWVVRVLLQKTRSGTPKYVFLNILQRSNLPHRESRSLLILLLRPPSVILPHNSLSAHRHISCIFLPPAPGGLCIPLKQY